MEKITDIVFDGEVGIATGQSRKAITWKNHTVPWSQVVKKLTTPVRTAETEAEYAAMPKTQRDELKDVGGFVGGMLKGGQRRAGAVAWRSLLTLDLDSVIVDPWPIVQEKICAACVMYSTHSSTKTQPRLRLVFPLARTVSGDEYAAISRLVASDIGIDMCDDSTYEAHRLMYWPSCCYDSHFVLNVLDAPWLDPDEMLARYEDWTDPAQWPHSSRQDHQIRSMAKKQGDPLEKNGVVGAFCRNFTIGEAIDEYLSDTYIACENGRYTYAAGSTVGGLVVYDDKFAYSHHGTDPVGGRLCNAFDLVRYHLYGDLDDGIDPATPTVKRPSFRAMCDLAMQQDRVRIELVSFDGETEDIEDWAAKLELTQTGSIKSTVNNIIIILQNDVNLKDTYAYDAFKERPIIISDTPWQTKALRTSDTWSDADDAGLRWYLEKNYGLDSRQKIRDSVDAVMLRTTIHPVKQYLKDQVWDGKSRIDTLLIDVFGAEDTTYTRAVTRKALIGAVARIFRPGCKHDHMLVLVGPQGCGKSTLLSKLGGEWFSDSLYTVVGKTAYEQLQGHWIIELGEMAATRKAELEQIKQFISKQSDSYRAAYDRRTSEHPRQCAFFGTTNDVEFLRDYTGGRRFWPVTVYQQKIDIMKSFTSDLINQIWAEAVAAYNNGEAWYLPHDLEVVAHEKQKEHTEVSSKQGMIIQFVEHQVLKDWTDKSLDERRMFWADPTGDTEPRDRICALEIWVELFNGDPKQFNPMQAREINSVLRDLDGWTSKSKVNMGGIYGLQRGFVRDDGKNT